MRFVLYALGLMLIPYAAFAAVTIPTTGLGGLINTVTPTLQPFIPSSNTLTGWPTGQYLNADGITTSTVLQAGWQQGDLVNNGQTVIYYPYNFQTGGGFANQNTQIPHGIVLTYNNAVTGTGFGSFTNFSIFDLTTTTITRPAGVTTAQDSPVLYIGGVLVGPTTYFVPGGGNNNYPVFVAYDTTKVVADTTAYTFFPAMDRGTTSSNTLGAYYGWDTGDFDGRFVYYSPSVDTLVPQHGSFNHGNIVRYDTTMPFTSSASWSHYDLAVHQNHAACVVASSACVLGFESSGYDGHRFIYFPARNTVYTARFDTWNGGVGIDSNAFTNDSAYKLFDATQLGENGFPAVTGIGNVSDLKQWTGVIFAWDRQHRNEYMYMVPWGSGPPDLTLNSTAVRARVGTMANGVWNYVDFTSSSAIPSPNWEIMDLSTFTLNAGWPSSWRIALPSGSEFTGDNQLSGWQLGWFDSSRNLVTFCADANDYFAQHDVDHDLWDPTSWTFGIVGVSYRSGEMGGAMDPNLGYFYPSPPGQFVIQVQGLFGGLTPNVGAKRRMTMKTGSVK